MSKETIQTGVRMVGHLLEHHGTAGTQARDQNGDEVHPTAPTAVCRCVIGANHVVSNRLGINYMLLEQSIYQVVRSHSCQGIVEIWEETSPETKQAFVKSLQEYVAE